MTDIEIANNHEPKKITTILNGFFNEDEIEQYGNYKAKVSVKEGKKKGKLILVTAINPTPAGEGKTTVSIGLADGLKQIGKKVCLALREPSLGPVFGVKGGATGGGYSQVVPMEDINLHFNGDLHAITSANNLLSAMIDNHLHQGNVLEINPKSITHKRCLDLNDRALRNVNVGLGGAFDGVMRQDGFNITAGSEVMAILCLASDIEDLKLKLGKIIIGYNSKSQPVTASDIKANEAMAILLKDAIKPNAVQSLGGVPALVHGGPFANIAHGCNSITATKTALAVSDYVVTEAGFGADLGAEKFLDVKCRLAGIEPSAVVIVATIRALKMHGGVDKASLDIENVEAVKTGLSNLKKHIENITKVFGLNAVVGINQFKNDTDNEIKAVEDFCGEMNVPVALANVWGEGGKGGASLAEKVVKACENKTKLKFAYKLNDSVEDKVKSVATKVYGAKSVAFSTQALKQIKEITKNGYNDLPIIIAKTQYSLSDDMTKIGCPKGFEINVREVNLYGGAGFIVAVCGSIMLMPGLPKVPAAVNMTIDNNGNIEGLF